MINRTKKSVRLFRKKYKVKDVSQSVLLSVLAEQGYTVIPFRPVDNQADVAQILDNLNLNDFVCVCSGFTYTNDCFRLVFIREDLSEEEKRVVLAHEEGHIYFEHFNAQPVIGRDVLQEHEANEFAHYLLYPGRSEQSRQWVTMHKKGISIAAACFLILTVGLSAFALTTKVNTYHGNFYVTETGKKYHKKECIYVRDKKNIRRLTEEEYKSGEYEACKVCLPEE